MTYEEIDALRLKAFKTNSDANRKAYFDAASKWFQDDIYRRMDHERELATLRAEVDRLREVLEFYADRGYDGYDVTLGDYGLSMSVGVIIQDAGDKAKEALK